MGTIRRNYYRWARVRGAQGSGLPTLDRKEKAAPGCPGAALISDRRCGSDAIGLERREAVEIHRAVARRVGASRFDVDEVADREVERQLVIGILIENVGAVAGR